MIYVEDQDNFAILQLRVTNCYFHKLIPAPTHDELLRFERTFFAVAYSLYTFKFCVLLRPTSNFALTMLKGKTGVDGKF
jgi:hypothetical protein